MHVKNHLTIAILAVIQSSGLRLNETTKEAVSELVDCAIREDEGMQDAALNDIDSGDEEDD